MESIEADEADFLDLVVASERVSAWRELVEAAEGPSPRLASALREAISVAGRQAYQEEVFRVDFLRSLLSLWVRLRGWLMPGPTREAALKRRMIGLVHLVEHTIVAYDASSLHEIQAAGRGETTTRHATAHSVQQDGGLWNSMQQPDWADAATSALGHLSLSHSQRASSPPEFTRAFSATGPSHRAGSPYHAAPTHGASPHRAGSPYHAASAQVPRHHRAGSPYHAVPAHGAPPHRAGSPHHTAPANCAPSHRASSPHSTSPHSLSPSGFAPLILTPSPPSPHPLSPLTPLPGAPAAGGAVTSRGADGRPLSRTPAGRVSQVAIGTSGHVLSISTGSLGDGLGVKVWASSLEGAERLLRRPQEIAGKTILELGAGCGVFGLTAARMGAREVWLTDVGEKVLANLERSARADAEARRQPMHLFRGAPEAMLEAAMRIYGTSLARGSPSSGFRVEEQAVFVAELDWAEALDGMGVRAEARRPSGPQTEQEEMLAALAEAEAEGGTGSAEPGPSADGAAGAPSPRASRVATAAAAKSLPEVAPTSVPGGGARQANAASPPAELRAGAAGAPATVPVPFDAASLPSGVPAFPMGGGIRRTLPRDATFDVVLAADVLYEPAASRSVAATLAKRLAPHGTAMLCNAIRDETILESFLHHLAEYGLQVHSQRIRVNRGDRGREYEGGYRWFMVWKG